MKFLILFACVAVASASSGYFLTPHKYEKEYPVVGGDFKYTKDIPSVYGEHYGKFAKEYPLYGEQYGKTGRFSKNFPVYGEHYYGKYSKDTPISDERYFGKYSKDTPISDERYYGKYSKDTPVFGERYYGKYSKDSPIYGEHYYGKYSKDTPVFGERYYGKYSKDTPISDERYYGKYSKDTPVFGERYYGKYSKDTPIYGERFYGKYSKDAPIHGDEFYSRINKDLTRGYGERFDIGTVLGKDITQVKKDFIVFYYKYLLEIVDLFRTRFGDQLAEVDTFTLDTFHLPTYCTKLNGMTRWMLTMNIDITKSDPQYFDYYMMCRMYDYIMLMKTYFKTFDMGIMYRDYGTIKEFYGLMGDHGYGLHKYYGDVFGHEFTRSDVIGQDYRYGDVIGHGDKYFGHKTPVYRTYGDQVLNKEFINY